MKIFKRKTKPSFKFSIHEKGVSKFTDETDMVEIVKSVRLLKILIKILLSNEQIKLLALENSSLLNENYGDKFDENSEIINDQNGINVRSPQVVPSKLESSKHQDAHEQHPNESQTDIGHKDLLSYLPKQPNSKFVEGINKLVDEFGSQENTPQKMMILKHGFGIAEDSKEDSKEDSSIGFQTSIEGQSENCIVNVRSVGDVHLNVPNDQNFIDDGPKQNRKLLLNSNQV